MKRLELRRLIREEIVKLVEVSTDLATKLKTHPTLSNNRKLRYGFTDAKLDKKNILTITHGGNMGDSIKDDVNPNLKGMGLPPIEKLKSEFKVVSEKGSPDYMYVIQFKIK